ncbi:hypothetical protein [Romboutsia lituseburensis]|uniref:Uncharacterized protein n=1 Tax=Romboutsia lituseburensis DSM 797 TaxID=1121325 RepID=A0A1G9L6W2_9FIRM|nr:hypothetical protein [Romboutsia lituseburensis]CEH35178.1 Hypothetical protein RLITU_2601 [Romboutsia lituseburensis]SDL57305.1 hypothetical protein SAMN04515677_102414 [Romboutsia lituseburensis DSM 797]
MKIEAIEVSKNKKDALRYILRKIPLMSRVAQFNTVVTDLHLEYIEIKVLCYEIISKEKTNKMFRHETKTNYITMLVNTYNGYSESVEKVPTTTRRYVTKSNIKKSKIGEEYIVEGVKNEILNFLGQNNNSLDKISLQNINIKEIKSIYKPYWVANFRGRSILVDA